MRITLNLERMKRALGINALPDQATELDDDAAQQFLSGKLVASRWYRDGIRPGDRLYFIETSGKIFHTGVAISQTHFVHCSAPEVQISSLKKGDRLYREQWDNTFLAAKRP